MKKKMLVFQVFENNFMKIEGGSNMTGTICV
jgi:hypothetical protein